MTGRDTDVEVEVSFVITEDGTSQGNDVLVRGPVGGAELCLRNLLSLLRRSIIFVLAFKITLCDG